MTTNERQILVDLIEKLEKHAQEKLERSKNESLPDWAKDHADTAYWYLDVAATELKGALHAIDNLPENN